MRYGRRMKNYAACIFIQFGYPAPKKPKLPFYATRIPDYNDVSQTLATEFTIALAHELNIAIFAHSQGGLILQRFRTWMLNEGRAQELTRIRTIVMLACPNGGSEYLSSLRSALGFGRRPQADSLGVLNRQVADTQRTVLQRIVNATGVDAGHCRIPFHVYAGSAGHAVRDTASERRDAQSSPLSPSGTSPASSPSTARPSH